MKNEKLTEDFILNYLSKNFSLQNNKILGVGDDCAVIPQNNKQAYLITTDMLTDGTHFLFNKISPQQIAQKSVAVNLSDIAAMGAIPKFIFLSCSIPNNIDKKWIINFFQAIKRICHKYNIELLGGDTIKSVKNLSVSITAIGVADYKNIKYRYNFSPDDKIFITGNLGESYLGLKYIKKNIVDKFSAKFIKKHYHPRPYIDEGIWLGKQRHVTAMMDISDGLYKDLSKMTTHNECGANLNLDNLPYSRIFKQACEQNKWDYLKTILEGGEDYVLLFTVKSQYATKITHQYQEKFGKLYCIGEITKTPGVNFSLDGKKKDISIAPFEHF